MADISHNVPERLQIVPLPGESLFPYRSIIVVVHNAALAALIKREKYFIAIPTQELPKKNVCVLAKALSCHEHDVGGETVYIFGILFISRISVADITESNNGGLRSREGTWAAVPDVPISRAEWRKAETQCARSVFITDFIHLRRAVMNEFDAYSDQLSSKALAKVDYEGQAIEFALRRSTQKNIGNILDLVSAYAYENANTTAFLLQISIGDDFSRDAEELLVTVDVVNRLKLVAPFLERILKTVESFTRVRWERNETPASRRTPVEAGSGGSPARAEGKRNHVADDIPVEVLVKAIFHDGVEAAHAAEKPIESEENILYVQGGLEHPAIAEMIEFLSGCVIGQERPIRTIARAFNLAMAGYLPDERPLLVVFFAGPTGVGKTELAHALPDLLWKKEKEEFARAKQEGRKPLVSEKDIASRPLVEVDCGMFAGSLSHGVSKLIGAPPGFVGSKGADKPEPPILRPENFPPNRITVLLFDEIEKAVVDTRDNGAEIIGVLMKILDKGVLVNNGDELVDFRKTVIIFTSNIGSVEIMQSAKKRPIGFLVPKFRKNSTKEETEKLNLYIYKRTQDVYEKVFRPEFRNRIHRLVVFRFLNEAQCRAVISKEFQTVRRWAQKRSVDVELGDDATQWILGEVSREEGVRKIRDFITKEIAEPLTRAHNLGLLREGGTYEVRTKLIASGDEKRIKAQFFLKTSVTSGSS